MVYDKTVGCWQKAQVRLVKKSLIRSDLGDLGTAVVKLADWEHLAEIHEAATLLDGRKQTATK